MLLELIKKRKLERHILLVIFNKSYNSSTRITLFQIEFLTRTQQIRTRTQRSRLQQRDRCYIQTHSNKEKSVRPV